jgi:hypothetical protein
MATDKQIAANRLNAKNSTGPRSDAGKRRSRRNATRHGLMAETTIGVHEDPAAYKALQRAIYGDYRPRTNFELELVARLVSLLWRLRRAVAIESGLLNIYAETIGKRKDAATTARLDVFYRLIRPLTPAVQTDGNQRRSELDDTSNPSRTAHTVKPEVTHECIARSFLRLASTDGNGFERLGRYEMSLWRQTLQIILLLNSINRGANNEGTNFNDRFLRLKNMSRRSRRILWPPFVPLA